MPRPGKRTFEQVVIVDEFGAGISGDAIKEIEGEDEADFDDDFDSEASDRARDLDGATDALSGIDEDVPIVEWRMGGRQVDALRIRNEGIRLE